MLRARNLLLPAGDTMDLVVEAGECLAITGPSGSGKSRLLRQIADLDPNEADLSLQGKDRQSFAGPEWRSRIVYLQPESGWWMDRTGDNFVAGRPDDDLFRRLNLDPSCLDQPVEHLSSGERQRLAFLRILPLKPRVLLMDEPTSALDPENTLCLEGLLAEFATGQGMAVILTSHDRDQVTRLADRQVQLPPVRPEGR